MHDSFLRSQPYPRPCCCQFTFIGRCLASCYYVSQHPMACHIVFMATPSPQVQRPISVQECCEAFEIYINCNSQRWDQVIVLQVSSKSQVFILKSQVKSQVKSSKSESSRKSRQTTFKSSPKSETLNFKSFQVFFLTLWGPGYNWPFLTTFDFTSIFHF